MPDGRFGTCGQMHIDCNTSSSHGESESESDDACSTSSVGTASGGSHCSIRCEELADVMSDGPSSVEDPFHISRICLNSPAASDEEELKRSTESL